jgi:hypothetical protein
MPSRGRISFFVVFALGLGVGLIELRARRRGDRRDPGSLRDRHLRALAETA